jgi:hypothetical protein
LSAAELSDLEALFGRARFETMEPHYNIGREGSAVVIGVGLVLVIALVLIGLSLMIWM